MSAIEQGHLALDGATLADGFTLTLLGRPATKKNRQRMIRSRSRSGRYYIRPLPEKRYVTWERGVCLQILKACRGNPPGWAMPMRLTVTLYEHPTQRGDLFGYLDALADALESSGLIANDRHIRALGDCKVLRDRDNPRVEFTLQAIHDNPAEEE